MHRYASGFLRSRKTSEISIFSKFSQTPAISCEDISGIQRLQGGLAGTYAIKPKITKATSTSEMGIRNRKTRTKPLSFLPCVFQILQQRCLNYGKCLFFVFMLFLFNNFYNKTNSYSRRQCFIVYCWRGYHCNAQRPPIHH